MEEAASVVVVEAEVVVVVLVEEEVVEVVAAVAVEVVAAVAVEVVAAVVEVVVEVATDKKGLLPRHARCPYQREQTYRWIHGQVRIMRYNLNKQKFENPDSTNVWSEINKE